MAATQVDEAGAGRFTAMVETLDTRIFTLPSQTSESDRRSLLRLQLFVRTWDPAYRYLETGSHLGGSLLPHLADPCCAAAVSIDPRPASQPDARGRSFDYQGNSTGRMLGLLRERLGAQPLGKLRTFDLDAAEVTPDMIEGPIRLALIDGEHTVTAGFSDFISILPLLAPDAVLAWHDANLVAEAIRNAERVLAWQGMPFRTLFLPENVAAMGLGAMAEPLAAELGPEALSRESYLPRPGTSWSGQWRWRCCAAAGSARAPRLASPPGGCCVRSGAVCGVERGWTVPSIPEWLPLRPAFG